MKLGVSKLRRDLQGFFGLLMRFFWGLYRAGLHSGSGITFGGFRALGLEVQHLGFDMGAQKEKGQKGTTGEPSGV